MNNERKAAIAIAKRFDDAVLNPIREQRARTPHDPSGYISRHESAFHTPRPGFEAAIASGIVMLRDYAVAHEQRFDSPIGEDYVLGECWFDILKSLRGLLNGEHGRLDGGFCDAALCNLAREAGFTEDQL